METLKKVRAEWEKGLEVLLALPHVYNDYCIVFVVLEDKKRGTYLLHRYFSMTMMDSQERTWGFRCGNNNV